MIQFVGPIVPEWLDQVKAVGKVTLLSYIPNNAYLVWADQAAETKLHKLAGSHGILQWVGDYHPYYKLPAALAQATGPVRVQVGLVDAPEAVSALQQLGQLAPAGAGQPRSRWGNMSIGTKNKI